MAYARTDDRVRIYYEEHGSVGSVVMLAYGLGGTTEQWDVNTAALSAAHRVILWEPRGHGRSGSPEDPSRYSFARWAQDLHAVLDHLGVRRAHVGGLSLGGGIAMHFTVLYPSRVLSLLITSSASASGRPLSVDDLVMRARSVKIAIEQGMDALAEFAMSENPNYRARLALDPGLRDTIREEYRRVTPVGYANSVRAMMGTEYITDRLSEIRAPVLLVTGDRDPGLDSMRLIHRKVRGSKFALLPSAGHFANRDQPEGWNRVVIDFLATVDGARTKRR